jgi:hypothetical protein
MEKAVEETVKDAMKETVEDVIKDTVLPPEENRFCDFGWWEVGVVILLKWKILNELVI